MSRPTPRLPDRQSGGRDLYPLYQGLQHDHYTVWNFGTLVHHVYENPHRKFSVPESSLARRIDEVVFPSQKVAVADSIDRHQNKKATYFAYPIASQPLLFWDSSVVMRQTKNSNVGWDRQNPTSMKSTTQYQYLPDLAFEPPQPGTFRDVFVKGYYKWTRGGLAGIDFGGKEIDTSKWK